MIALSHEAWSNQTIMKTYNFRVENLCPSASTTINSSFGFALSLTPFLGNFRWPLFTLECKLFDLFVNTEHIAWLQRACVAQTWERECTRREMRADFAINLARRLLDCDGSHLHVMMTKRTVRFDHLEKRNRISI